MNLRPQIQNKMPHPWPHPYDHTPHHSSEGKRIKSREAVTPLLMLCAASLLLLAGAAAADQYDEDPDFDCDWEGLDCVVPAVVPRHGDVDLQVTYLPPNGLRQDVTNGKHLFPVQTHEPPTVKWPDPKVGEYHTFILVDLDAPSREDPVRTGADN